MADWQPLATARHIFVPDHSLADTYSQTALVTQWRTVDELGNKRPTSSASAPGVVAAMLERLNVQDHHRVLEIGTGTGYNAALLCHRLGSTHVYSNDIDPALIGQAGSRSIVSDTSPHSSPPTAIPGSLTVHPTIASWPPARSLTFLLNGYDNSPMAAVSSPPSLTTRPNPSSFSTK